MRIERLLRTAVVRSELGTHQRQQAEELLEHFLIAKKYSFEDRDFEDLDRRDSEFKGLGFDKATSEILLGKGFLIFRILPIPYRVMNFENREEVEIVPEEREVAVMGHKHFIAETRKVSSFEGHVAVVYGFKENLRRELWTVDVVTADVATYDQIEGQFNRYFDYKRAFFEMRDSDRTRLETFTSSKFGEKVVVLGQHGRGFGTTPTFSGLVDPEKFDATKAESSLGQRAFVAIPVVVPLREPLFLF